MPKATQQLFNLSLPALSHAQAVENVAEVLTNVLRTRARLQNTADKLEELLAHPQDPATKAMNKDEAKSLPILTNLCQVFLMTLKVMGLVLQQVYNMHGA